MSIIEHEKTSRVVVFVLELLRVLVASLAGFLGGTSVSG